MEVPKGDAVKGVKKEDDCQPSFSACSKESKEQDYYGMKGVKGVKKKDEYECLPSISACNKESKEQDYYGNSLISWRMLLKNF
jgi:hypothetical protein